MLTGRDLLPPAASSRSQSAWTSLRDATGSRGKEGGIKEASDRAHARAGRPTGFCLESETRKGGPLKGREDG